MLFLSVWIQHKSRLDPRAALSPFPCPTHNPLTRPSPKFQATASLVLLQDMFDAADMDNDGLLSYGELARAMQKASKEYSHLEEYSRYLDRYCLHASPSWCNCVSDSTCF